jgi:hypothetical protein
LLLTLKTGLPTTPLLVVINITPLAPLTPYTAVAEASFNIEMLSTELMSIVLKALGRSTPSTRINGPPPLNVVWARINI